MLALGLVLTEIIEPERSIMGVDIPHRFFDPVIGLDGQKRPENLLLHDLHVVGGIKDQGGGDAAMRLLGQVLAGRIDLDNLGPFGAGVGQIGLQALIVPVIDDGRIVRIVADGREHFRRRRRRLAHEAVNLVARRQHIVGRQTDLARIQGLAVQHARCGQGDVSALADNDRALAAQLQRDRHQIFGGGAHYVPPDRGGPGEDHVVEGEGGESLAHIRPAQHHGDLLIGKGLGDHGFQEGRAGGGDFRRLDHCAVARRQNAGHGGEGQVERKVPGADQPDHALGLVAQLGLGAEQAQNAGRGGPLLGPHPTGRMGLCVLQRADRSGYVGKGGGDL